MRRPRPLPLTVAATVVLSMANLAPAQTSRAVPPPQNPAQGQAGADNQSNQPQNQPRAPWDDPAMRLRRLRSEVSKLNNSSGRGGGRGGFFGGGGGGGGMIPLLLRTPALQDELKLSNEQKQALAKVSDSSSEERRAAFEQMRNQMQNSRNNNANQGGGRGGRGGRGGFDPAMMQQMQQAMTALNDKTEQQINSILSTAQRNRLEQIRLRIIGPTAVAEPEVAQKLLINDVQYQQIQAIIEQMNTQQRELMTQQFQNMRGNFPRPGGQGGPGQGGAAPGQGRQPANGGIAGNNNPQQGGPQQGGPQQGGPRGGGRPDFNSPEFQAMRDRMAEMGVQQDKLLKAAESAIARVLLPKQKSSFNKMLGASFDLSVLLEPTNNPRFGGPQNRGPRGQGGGAAPVSTNGRNAVSSRPATGVNR